MVFNKLIHHISLFRRRQAASLGQQSGQSLIILAFAFLGLIAMLGLALDLGLVYVERVRIKRSVDAATLAGVVELPYEQWAFDRALEYLSLNGYDSTDPDTYVFVAGCIRDMRDRFDTSCNLTNQSDGDTSKFCRTDVANPYLYNKPVTNPYTHYNYLPPEATWFLLDTSTYKGESSPNCDADQLIFGTANKLEITGTVSVDMNFMQFFGFNEVPVPDNALAENVSSLDVGVVFDVSGSMGYDPVCRGCWYRTNNDWDDIPPEGGSYPYYYDYPKNGDHRTIEPTTVISNRLCTEDPPGSLVYNNRRYQVIEAELYSRNTSVIDTRFREAGKSYWVLQRNGSGAARFNDDPSEPGTYVSQHPERTFYPESPPQPYGRFYTQVDAETGAARHLEYEFSFKSETSPTWGSQARIFIRARRGDYGRDLQ
ncbi:MAG: Tad domain-containing protein, partial [Candidatus Thorarchaeota archaeon]